MTTDQMIAALEKIVAELDERNQNIDFPGDYGILKMSWAIEEVINQLKQIDDTK